LKRHFAVKTSRYRIFHKVQDIVHVVFVKLVWPRKEGDEDGAYEVFRKVHGFD